MDDIVTDVGGRLRRARQQCGLSLHDAAGLTKLPIYVLQAIERNDFDSLPAGMYRKAYVRTLAGEVGLDPNEIAVHYGEQCEPIAEAPAFPSRDSAQERWVRQLTPSPRWSVVRLAALAAPVVIWFSLQRAPEMPAGPLNDIASEFVALPMTVPMTLAADTPRDVARPNAIPPQRTDVRRLRIGLAAMGWCWVAADVDGERVMYRLVEPGERLVLEGQRTISLRLGDAGSMTLSINDGPRRSAGGDGEVVELKLTPDNVEALRDGAVETVSGD